ncbi:MAG TPA: hypothetical protein VGM53_23300 [Streptosporangiaceae bacterium]
MLRWSARDARRRGSAGGWLRAAAVTAAVLAPLTAVSACASGPAPAASGGQASSPAAGGGSSPSPSAVHPGSSPPVVPVGGAPNIPVVRLGSRFAPGTLRLGTGQHFEVIVSRGVKPTGSGISGPCTPAAAARFSSAMLSLSCTGGAYLYTARQAGHTTLTVSVRPACTAGTMCPQWMTVARLALTIS